MKDRDRLLASIARDQRGIFTLNQAIAVGLPSRAIRERVRRGVLERIHPSVFGVAGSEDGWHRQALAAVLSATEPAAASHRTAALLWGLTDQMPEVIEIVSRRHRRVRRQPFVVHESKDLVESDIVVVDGIPITSAVRTVVDLGASAPPRLVERCLDVGIRKKLFSAWDARCFIARVARSGRNGVGTIRPLVEQRIEWDTVTESNMEDLLVAIVGPSPFPLPDAQHRVFEPTGEFVGRFDFAYPTRMALIETDSERWHMDPVSFQRDREKQNRAHALGWTVYRFTWRQLVEDPESVLDIIAAIWTD
ncbi:MAG: type IV toxin-antitoxin system AbiEi family antitoxin domain-containing protein [Actinomycetota bacterium]|nr:type IV toxin-antitoxin system AbiEi family antitoxin domain-containing protein [Actinomycetota bacterium]